MEGTLLHIQSYKNVFGKLLEAAVVVRYASGADKCYLHKRWNIIFGKRYGRLRKNACMIAVNRLERIC